MSDISVTVLEDVVHVATVGLQGPPGPPADPNLISTLGTTVGITEQAVTGEPVISFFTPWGIDSAGEPYWDPAGAAPGEEAAVKVADDGQIAITKVEADVLAGEEPSAPVASVPVFGVYESATTPILRSRVFGDRQDRFQLLAGGNEAWFGDGQNALHRLWHVEPHSGGTPEQMSGVNAWGLDAGLGASLYRGNYFGKNAGRDVVGGQSVLLMGDAAGQFTQSNESWFVGVNSGANITTGNFCTGGGSHTLESLIDGHRNNAFADECLSFLVHGSDNNGHGFYCGSVDGSSTGFNGHTGMSPTSMSRVNLYGNYIGYFGRADVDGDFSDWNAFGYHILNRGNFTGGMGNLVTMLADGAWAFGTAADGTPAVATVRNQFMLGTAQHTVTLPGSVEMTLAGKGLVMKSPNGTRFSIAVTDAGTLAVTAA